MVKLRIALLLGLLVGILTLTIGILHEVRPLTILNRVAISATLFSCVGYGFGIMFENILQEMLSKLSLQERDTDITTQEEKVNEDQLSSDFTPFTSTNFEHVSRPEE